MGAPQNMCELPLVIRIGGEVRPSYTSFVRPCAYAVVLDTKILAAGLGVHLNSDSLGDPERATRSSHFADALGALPRRTEWRTIEHPAGQLDIRWKPSECLYDHLCRLLDLLEALGHAGKVEVSDEVLRPFEALSRGLSVAAGRPEPPPLRSSVADVLGPWSVSRTVGERHAQA